MLTNATHRKRAKTREDSTDTAPTPSQPQVNQGRKSKPLSFFSRMKGNTNPRLKHSQSKLVAIILIPCTLLLYLVWNHAQRYTYAITTEEDRCWLKDAFLNGNFLVGSHRSLGDAKFEAQPNCLQGLMQLNTNNIHYLDLDLIWDPNQQEIVVAHPMEFQGTTDFYSPCAKLTFREVLQNMQTAIPKFLVSLEPKADWDRTKQHKILKEPTLVLQEMLKVLQQANLKSQKQECSLIIDANKVLPKEERLIEQVSQYCSLMMPVRRSEGHDAKMAVQKQQHYKYLCPTIEFHPTHPNHHATVGYESLQMAQQQVTKSIYWVVDSLVDLERVALLKGYGLVSNRPLEIVKMMQDPKYNWCTKKTPGAIKR